MATYEVYVGGPPTANYSRAMFPAPAFNAAAAWALAMKPSAHKGPADFNLGRVLKPGTSGNTYGDKDYAMQQFIKDTAIVQGDVLGTILIPQNCVFKGLFYDNKVAVGAATVITPSVRGVGAASFPTIDANAVAKGFTRGGSAAWAATSSAIDDTNDGTEFFIAAPTVIDLTLTTLTAKEDLLNLDLTIVARIELLQTGVW